MIVGVLKRPQLMQHVCEHSDGFKNGDFFFFLKELSQKLSCVLYMTVKDALGCWDI